MTHACRGDSAIPNQKLDLSRVFFSAFVFCVTAIAPVSGAGDQRKEDIGRSESGESVPVCEHKYVTYVDYVIITRRFPRLDTAKQTWVEKCVFHPIYPTGICPRDSQASITRSALSSLKSYRVYDRDGRVLDRKYGQFHMAETDLHGYPASDVPPGGCGDFLVAWGSKVVTGEPPTDLSIFMEMLREKEERLFVTTLRRPPDWVTLEQRRDIAKHDLKETYERSKKSDVDTFYDGRMWYLVRSYSTGTPTTLNVLILYRIDPTRNNLHPQLAFLSTARGEGWLNVRYFGALDMRNDDTNDLIVEVFGLEYSYFAQIRREADSWRFR